MRPADGVQAVLQREGVLFDLQQVGKGVLAHQANRNWTPAENDLPPASLAPPFGKGGRGEGGDFDPAFAEGGSERNEPGDFDPTAPLVERLGEEAESLINALLDPVRAALEASADLMDFRARLLTLYPDLDGKAFADLMGQALAVADAMGQWEARP